MSSVLALDKKHVALISCLRLKPSHIDPARSLKVHFLEKFVAGIGVDEKYPRDLHSLLGVEFEVVFAILSASLRKPPGGRAYVAGGVYLVTSFCRVE